MDEEKKDELTPEELQVEETEEVTDEPEAEEAEEVEGETEEATEEPTEEPAEEAADDIADLRAELAELKEIIQSGFTSLNALFVEGGGVVREYETAEDKEEFIDLEDLDYNI